MNNSHHPVLTIAQSPCARFIRIGTRFYIEAGAGRDYIKKAISKRTANVIMDTAKALNWGASDLNTWLHNNYEKYTNQ